MVMSHSLQLSQISVPSPRQRQGAGRAGLPREGAGCQGEPSLAGTALVVRARCPMSEQGRGGDRTC